jgi:peroxiredoxin Q/BCP
MHGDVAEDFTLKDQYGKAFNLYSNLSRKILLVFYPKDNTPVCTRQLTDYQLNKKLFEKLDISIVGISTGSERSHFHFASKCSLDFPLLADDSKKVAKKYKAVNLFGIIKRKVVLISENRKILLESEVMPLKYQTSSQLIAQFGNIK